MPLEKFKAACGAVLLCGALAAHAGPSGEMPERLLFWSGFEGPLELLPPTDCYRKGCFQDLVGTDSSTGFRWPLQLLGGESRFQLLVDGPQPPTRETVGDYMVNELRTVIGHNGKPTRALYSEVRRSGCCGNAPQGRRATQNAFQLLPRAEPADLYLSKWVMLQPDLLDKLRSGDAWRAIFEWKEGVRDNGAFRVTLGVVAYNGSPLTWEVRWDNLAGPVPKVQVYHRKFDKTVQVPRGEWFKLEVYWHRSNGGDGRTWFAVNGRVIDDHRGPNIGGNGTPVGRIFLNQVYSGGSYPLYQWTDDIQVWKGFPVADRHAAWYDPPYAPH